MEARSQVCYLVEEGKNPNPAVNSSHMVGREGMLTSTSDHLCFFTCEPEFVSFHKFMQYVVFYVYDRECIVCLCDCTQVGKKLDLIKVACVLICYHGNKKWTLKRCPTGG